jgi:uncharacterized protein YcaQ
MSFASTPTLRRYAVARTLFTPTHLGVAIERLGFVQADPIRAPARAQDLILRHRVTSYRATDLERQYPELSIDEEYFVNYGFMPNVHLDHLHPRKSRVRRNSPTERRIAALLDYAREHGEVHPRAAAAHFAHGRVTNLWGGASHATTQLLDRMHYEGLLRVARRDNGIRVYAARQAPPGTGAAALAGTVGTVAAASGAGIEARGGTAPTIQAERLLDLVVRLYAPLPAASLTQLVAMLRHAAPQLRRELQQALARAKQLLAHTVVDGATWYWPADESPADVAHGSPEGDTNRVRLLAPFDPLVWDRRRFEQFWGWTYRFEAYTPPAKRKLGYYALPLLWRDQVIGWGNLSVADGRLVADVGYTAGKPPRVRVFRSELEAELARFAVFLGLPNATRSGPTV